MALRSKGKEANICNFNVVVESALSYQIKVHHILETHHLCFMTVVACTGTGTTST
jgi:hypothetical protein